MQNKSNATTTGIRKNIWYYLKIDRQLILMSIPMIAFYMIFVYYPMYGASIAFKDFSPALGINGSPWVGLKYFYQVFENPFFIRLMRNTFIIGLYSLVWGFPVPIIFALCVNEITKVKYKKVVQTVSYMPFFISVVVVVGLLYNFLSPTYGVVNTMYTSLTGNDPINFMNSKQWFRTLYIGSGIWQTFGWNSIIYLAALAGIDPQLYDSADIDGASRMQKVVHITLPSIRNTIIILFILSLGGVMNTGFEKIILMYSPSTYEVADVLQTFTYRKGIVEANFSFGAAMGLFNSLINVIFLCAANWISKRVSEVSLW